MQNDLLNKYLLERGLWEPRMALKEGEKDDIMDDAEKLARVAGMFATFKDAFAWLLQEKVKRLALDVVRDIAPSEVIIYRQAMVEVASLWDEAEKYFTEYEKREKEKEDTASAEGAPIIEDNVPAADNGSEAHL